MDMKSHKVEITKIIEADARGLYSTSMMKMPTTVKGFKQVVMQNFKLADGFEKLSGVGFYEIGKALLKAKEELKHDFGNLKKELAKEGLHEKKQERYMMVANSDIVQKYYNKLPPEFTTWLKLTQLQNKMISQNKSDAFEDSMKQLINPKMVWKDVSDHFKLNVPSSKKRRDHYETHYISVDWSKKVHKKDKKLVMQLEKDLKQLLKKYKFATLKRTTNASGGYVYDQVIDFVKDKVLEDDTVSTTKKVKRPTYSNKKRTY